MPWQACRRSIGRRGPRESREEETRSGLGTTGSSVEEGRDVAEKKKGREREREREKKGLKRAYSGNEVDHGGVDRGASRVRAAPYLRNFKLNCDVFKLRFLPALLAPRSSSLQRPPCTSSPRRFN